MEPRSSVAPWCNLIVIAAGVVLFAGCAEDDQAREAALRDLQQQKQLTTQRDQTIQARELEIQTLKRQLDDAESERQGAQKAIANATQSMEDLARARAQAEARAAEFRKLVAHFSKMIEAGKLMVAVRDNRMIVTVSVQALFDPGKTQLRKDGAETLKEVTAVLKDVAGRDFQVAGHTDNAPIRPARLRSNWDLSTARAVEVVLFMIASGMPPKRLSAAGYADQAPLGSNDSPDGRSKNRRIEITLVPNLDDLAPIPDDGMGLRPEGSPSPNAEGLKTLDVPGSDVQAPPTPAIAPPTPPPTGP